MTQGFNPAEGGGEITIGATTAVPREPLCGRCHKYGAMCTCPAPGDFDEEELETMDTQPSPARAAPDELAQLEAKLVVSQKDAIAWAEKYMAQSTELRERIESLVKSQQNLEAMETLARKKQETIAGRGHYIQVLERQLAAAPKLWECENCAFAFDAVHVCEDGTYTCPACAEHRLEKELAVAQRVREAASEVIHADKQYGLVQEKEMTEAFRNLEAALGAATRPEAGIEVRLNGDDTLDEVVANNVSFHLEQMDDTGWWMGITKGQQSVMVNLFTKGKRPRPVLATWVDESEGGAEVTVTGGKPEVGDGT